MKSGSFRVPPRKKIYKLIKTFILNVLIFFLKTMVDIKSPTYNEFDEAFCSVLNVLHVKAQQ